MKKFSFWFIVMLASSTLSHGQFSFGVSPGLNLNSVYFGYKLGKAVPNLGFQYMHLGLTMEDSGDSDNNIEAKGNLFIPQIGCKLFIAQKNKVKTFVALNIAKPFLSGKIIEDGEEDQEVKETLDNISLFGGQLGIGAEYFFDDNFSLGGEFGFRMLHLKYKHTYTDEHMVYNPETNTYDYYETEETIEAKSNLNPTYSRISLNYYF